ncbi:MAG TPA: carboxymuconolactone decarboxylase family protein [Bacteroidales bacterium]|jgi:AhpD family alkylhydroperoxidase|nr:carboxymuconolactone decarboxylase family protein [Bacteroidales bacterium]
MSKVKEFKEYRLKMNKAILDGDNKVIKRLFSVDTMAYDPGALNTKTKEMLGLVSSLVLRCDDCVKYHLEKLSEIGTSDAEIHEIFGIAMLVGGSIVIPHTRRAVEFWNELNKPDAL